MTTFHDHLFCLPLLFSQHVNCLCSLLGGMSQTFVSELSYSVGHPICLEYQTLQVELEDSPGYLLLELQS